MCMTDTAFELSDVQRTRVRRTPVDAGEQREFERLGLMGMVEAGIDFSPNDATARGDGGLKGALSDWIKLAEMFLNKGIYKGKRILSQASLKAMETNSLPGDAELVPPFAQLAVRNPANFFGATHAKIEEGKDRVMNTFPGQGF